MLKVLQERHFKIKELLCLADPSEAGTIIEYAGERITVQGAGGRF
jgi:aspartate-semialdehyde dehydrogenase